MPMLQDKPVPEDKIQICGPCERDGDSVNAEYWCSECNDAFCDTCLSSCQTEAAENITEINPLRLVIESFLIDMNDLDDSAKLAMLSQRKHIEVLNSSRARSKERLTSLITSAKLRLDECHDKLNCALDQVHLEKTKQFMENENQIKRFRKILSSGQKLLHHVKEQRNAAQKVIALENTKTQIKNEIDNLKPVADEDKQTILALNFAEIFDTIKQLESVGELKIKESKSGQNVKPLFDAAKDFSNPLQHKPDIKKINLVKMFDITMKKKPRWITGGVFLKDDRLLFADRKNKKLKLYDPSGILKSAVQLNYSPWDVAFCGAEKKVLVSDTDQEYIRSYAVSATEIKEEGSVKVSNRKKAWTPWVIRFCV
ncbi:hypothetical protein KUTeg_009361 [Tegillarca granosa]|uniref:B box-type domain-containing protein n=1 Tax=Tegillarca granosa TaxID=220873 RepID=A0ABQ9F3M2_TEGGR|nr:hypothetical protein KUTeg_009361 [Tegillarca granosa]